MCATCAKKDDAAERRVANKEARKRRVLQLMSDVAALRDAGP